MVILEYSEILALVNGYECLVVGKGGFKGGIGGLPMGSTPYSFMYYFCPLYSVPVMVMEVVHDGDVYCRLSFSYVWNQLQFI